MDLNPQGRRRLIVDLDTVDSEKASNLIRWFGSQAGGFKVSKELLGHVKNMAPLAVAFCDRKLHDTPNRMITEVAKLVESGCDMFTVDVASGPRSLETAAKYKGSAKLVASTILTSLTKLDLERIGYSENLSIEELVIRHALLALECGCDGIVCSGQELDAIAAVPELTKLFLVTPGCRIVALPDDDQQRLITPYEAISKGSSFVVVGRPITLSVDPWMIMGRFVEQIKAAEAAATQPVGVLA